MGTSRSRGPASASPELTGEDQAIRVPDSQHGSRANSQAWLRSFGRRKGRKLSDRQSLLLSTSLERLKLDLGNAIEANELAQMFAPPAREVWLEIGFGAGEHLVWQAEHNADIGLVGAEPYVNGVVAVLSAVEARHLYGRVRIHADDAVPLLDWLPTASIARAFMPFPDPWPKKRHRARRLLSPFLLNKLARILRPNAQFRFASDSADYADAAVEYAKAHPAFDLAQVFTSANRTAMPDWPITRYEAKANKAGRSSTFVVMERKSGEVRDLRG